MNINTQSTPGTTPNDNTGSKHLGKVEGVAVDCMQQVTQEHVDRLNERDGSGHDNWTVKRTYDCKMTSDPA